MTPYWVLFLFPAFAALLPIRSDVFVRNLAFGMFAFIGIALVGLRYEIGGDWITYQNYFNFISRSHLADLTTLQDPGYVILNLLSAELGLGIIGVNLFGAAILFYGLLRFSGEQPCPWLGIAVAVPFLIIVVGMGYTRQAIAMGFIFLAISKRSQKSLFKYIAWILVASLFHKTAVLMFIFLPYKNHWSFWIIISILLPFIAGISYTLVLTSNFITQFQSYTIGGIFTSHGAMIRVLMNLVPAVGFLMFYKKFQMFGYYRFWAMTACLCVALFPFVFQYSTLIDRVSVYFSPIQIAFYSRLPILVNNSLLRTFVVIAILAIYAAVLFVWLNYAVHREHWVPYQWILSQ